MRQTLQADRQMHHKTEFKNSRS